MHKMSSSFRGFVITLLAASAMVFTACSNNAAEKQGSQGGSQGAPANASGQGGGEKRGPRTFPVRVAKVETQAVSYKTQAVGSLLEENLYRLPARVNGIVETVKFVEGDAVTTGQELARIDYNRYNLLADRARKEVAEKQAALNAAKARYADAVREAGATSESAALDFSLARSEYQRRTRLLTAAAISEEEKSQFENRYRKSESTYISAMGAVRTKVDLESANVQQSEASYQTALATQKLAEADLSDAIVRAPIAGEIQTRDIVTGQYVEKGDPIAQMVQIDPIRLKFSVPESRAATLVKDMDVEFTVASHPTKTFVAKVYTISDSADTVTREIPVWARAENADKTLRPGYFASVSLTSTIKKSAVVVPLPALLPSEFGMTVYVINDGIAQRRKVRSGLQIDSESIEILEGLNPGELLVVEGMNSLQNNVAVNIMPGKPMTRGILPISEKADVADPNSTSTLSASGG